MKAGGRAVTHAGGGVLLGAGKLLYQAFTPTANNVNSEEEKKPAGHTLEGDTHEPAEVHVEPAGGRPEGIHVEPAGGRPEAEGLHVEPAGGGLEGLLEMTGQIGVNAKEGPPTGAGGSSDDMEPTGLSA